MLRPSYHERHLARHPVHPAPSLASTRPQSEPAATTPNDPAPKQDTPPLTASEKDNLFRQFDTYISHSVRDPGAIR